MKETLKQILEKVNKIDTIEEKVSRIDAIEEKVNKIDTIEEKVNRIDTIEEKVSRIDAIEEKVSRIDNEVGTLKKDVGHLKDIQGTMKMDIDIIIEKIDANGEQLRRDFNKRFDKLEEKMDNELAKVKSDIKELQSKVC